MQGKAPESQGTNVFRPFTQQTPNQAQASQPVPQSTNVFRPVSQQPAPTAQMTQAYRPAPEFQRAEAQGQASQSAEQGTLPQETRTFKPAPLNPQEQELNLKTKLGKANLDIANAEQAGSVTDPGAAQAQKTAEAAPRRVRRTERFRDLYNQDNNGSNT